MLVGDIYESGGAAVAADHLGNVYLGGKFLFQGDSGSRIARWDGSGWNKLGAGKYGAAYIYAIAPSGSDVYMGGYFNNLDNFPAKNIARWDGSSWNTLGGGVYTAFGGGNVSSIAVSGSDVYVGGSFSSAGGITVTNIARWDGAAWHALGASVSCANCLTRAIAVNGSDVYVSTDSADISWNAINNITRWDGAAWHALGSGLDSAPADLVFSSGKLYAAGQFKQCTDPLASSPLAVWDGASWAFPLCGQDGGFARALAVNGRDVYLGGLMDTIQGVPVHHIARWNGETVLALGTGVNGYVNDISIDHDEVYVAGDFSYAGEKFSNMYAIWHIPSTPMLTPTYTEGTPGSSFTFSAENFPPNTPVTITVNAYTFPVQMTDANGRLTLTLHTALAAQNGRYIVTFSVPALQGLAPSAAGQAYTYLRFEQQRPNPYGSGSNAVGTARQCQPGKCAFSTGGYEIMLCL